MRLSLPWLAAIALLGTVVAWPALEDQMLDVDATLLGQSVNDSISTSSLSRQIQDQNVSKARKMIFIGEGRRASQFISNGSQIDGQMWIKDRSTGISMSQQFEAGHDVNQTLAMSLQDSRRQGDSGMNGISGAQMKVVENVSGGIVSIEVIQGGTTGWKAGQSPFASARRNPSLEMDERYVGSFYIEKNMSIQVSLFS